MKDSIPPRDVRLTSGLKLLAKDSKVRQDSHLNSSIIPSLDLENVNFNDDSALPDLVPPAGFSWEFIIGCWALKPVFKQPMISVDCVAKEASEQEDLHSPSNVMETPDSLYESDDSVSEFERNLRELMPGMIGEPEPAAEKHTKGTKRSERPKKPSSRFNEEAGYIAKPLKPTKKKPVRGDVGEGTSSKPLLISDWNNDQLDNLLISDLEHICMLEQSRIAPPMGKASSKEDRAA